MAAAFVQQSAETVVAALTSPANVVFPSATTAGNLVVLVCCNMGGTATSFTSSGFAVDQTSGTYGYGLAVLSKIESSGTTTYSVAFGGSPGWRVIGFEFSGVEATSYVEASAANNEDTTSAPTAAPSGQIDTTVGGPIVLAYVFDRTPSPSGPSGFTGTTLTTYAPGSNNAYVAYKVEAGTSTDQRGAITSDPTHYDALIVAYKASAGGGSSITADEGTFTHTGQAVNLLFGRKLTADFGSFALSGQDVTLTKTTAYSITADYGSFSLAGQDVAFQKTDAGSYVLTAEVGLFSLVGQGALASYSMNAEIGSFVIAGQEVTFSIGVPAAYSLTADAGSYSLTGQNARLDWSGAPIVPNRQAGIYMGMRIGL